MPGINDIDRRVIDSLSGADKIKALLSSKGFTLREFAEKHNQWVDNVSRCIHGDRPLPEIREALAAELDMERNEIDTLIEGAAT